MSEIDYKAIGQRIREARKEKGLTQEQASELCDITPSYYGNIERGDKKMSLETLARISKGLCVSTDQLIFGCGEKTEEDDILHLLSQIRNQEDEVQYRKYLNIIKAISTIIDKL